MTAPFFPLRHGFQRLLLHCRMWRLARCLNGLGREAAGGSFQGRVTVCAGIGLGLVLVGQMNAPAYLRQQEMVPYEQSAGLAACVVMGPRQVKRENSKGFTLIEMSIVLVIIGLVVGGVLVGRDLIKAAEIRQTISQKESFDAAVNTFVSKYNALPGDMANASQFGLNTSSLCGNCNGNGDGLIGWYNSTNDRNGNGDEYKTFWLHLYNAGLLKSNQLPGSLFYGGNPTVSGYHSPTCPICHQFAYSSSGSTVQAGGWAVAQFQNFQFLNCNALGYWTSYGGQLPSWNAFVITDVAVGSTGGNAPQLTGRDAYAIDSKVDDGLPLTGNVLTYNPYTNPNAACVGAAPWYNNQMSLNPACNSGNTYSTSSNAPCGQLIMRASF